MSTVRRLNRRDFLRLSMATGAGAVLAACAPKPSPTATEEVVPTPPSVAEKVKLTVWTNDRLYVEHYQYVSEPFAEAHPEYDFEFVVEENPDLWDNLITVFAGGMEDVDIVGLEQGPILQLWKSGIAEQMLIPFNDVYSKQELDQFMRSELYTYNGKLYGVETSMCLCAYYYQPAIFERYGVDAETIDTYDDFIRVGQALAADGKYMTVVATTGLDTQLDMMALQNGGGFFSVDGEVIIDSPATIEAVQLGYDMVKTHQVGLASSDQYSPAGLAVFSEGLVAGVMQADWYSGYFIKDLLTDMAGEWRIRPLPRVKAGGSRTSGLGGTTHGILNTSKHADLAFGFNAMAWMDKENLIQYFLKTDYFPPMKACWQDKRILEYGDSYYGDQLTGAVWAALAPEAPLNPTHAYKAEAQDITAKEAIVPIFEGEKSVEQGLKDAADAVRELIGA